MQNISKCKQNHQRLYYNSQKYQAEDGTQSCLQCRRSIKSLNCGGWSCCSCNDHVCERCGLNQTIQNFCNNGHLMVTVKQDRVLATVYSQFQCDTCKKKVDSNNDRYFLRCMSCDQDLCSECDPYSVKKNPAMIGNYQGYCQQLEQNDFNKPKPFNQQQDDAWLQQYNNQVKNQNSGIQFPQQQNNGFLIQQQNNNGISNQQQQNTRILNLQQQQQNNINQNQQNQNYNLFNQPNKQQSSVFQQNNQQNDNKVNQNKKSTFMNQQSKNTSQIGSLFNPQTNTQGQFMNQKLQTNKQQQFNLNQQKNNTLNGGLFNPQTNQQSLKNQKMQTNQQQQFNQNQQKNNPQMDGLFNQQINTQGQLQNTGVFGNKNNNMIGNQNVKLGLFGNQQQNNNPFGNTKNK